MAERITITIRWGALPSVNVPAASFAPGTPAAPTWSWGSPPSWSWGSPPGWDWGNLAEGRAPGFTGGGTAPGFNGGGTAPGFDGGGTPPRIDWGSPGAVADALLTAVLGANIRIHVRR